MDFFFFLTSSVFLLFIAFGLRPSGLASDGFLFIFWLPASFSFYCFWFKAVGFRLRCFFVYFFTSSVFLHSIAFGLRPSVLGCDGFFFVFWLRRLFAFYCLSFKALGFRLPWIFFCFLTSCVFLHFITFDLRPWGLGSDGFLFIFWLPASFCILLLLF